MNKLVMYAVFLILSSFFITCGDVLPSLVDQYSYWQVYEELSEEIYTGSVNIVGVPSKPLYVLEGGSLGATVQVSDVPWTIEGSITDGMLSIDFSNSLDLSDEFASEYTNNVKIARVHITEENNRNAHIALSKYDTQEDGGVTNITGVVTYYTDKDFNYQTSDGTTITFKAGWNFFDDNTNVISQDINYFFKQGYKWSWENWY